MTNDTNPIYGKKVLYYQDKEKTYITGAIVMCFAISFMVKWDVPGNPTTTVDYAQLTRHRDGQAVYTLFDTTDDLSAYVVSKNINLSN